MHIIVPALTVFHWTVTAAYAALNPRIPAAIAAHSRDFHAVKRQFRNADYAHAAPPNPMATSGTAPQPYPTTTTSSDSTPASRATNPAKSSSKTSRSLDLQPRYNPDFSDPLLLNRAGSSDTPAPEEHNALDTRKVSPNVADDSRRRSREEARYHASRRLPTQADVGKTHTDTNYVRRSPTMIDVEWWKKREEPSNEAVSKSHASSRDSEIITRALQALPAKRFTAEPTPVPRLDSKHLRRLVDSNVRGLKMHDLPAHQDESSRKR